MDISFNDKITCFLLETALRQMTISDFSFTQIKELSLYIIPFQVSSKIAYQGEKHCVCLQFTYIYSQGPVKQNKKNNEKEKQIFKIWFCSPFLPVF